MPKSPDKPKKPKDYARPTRAKAHRPDAPKHDPALDDLLNPGIGRGRAGMGSGTGLQPPPDNSFDRRADRRDGTHRAPFDAGGVSREAAIGLCRALAVRGPAGIGARSGAGEGTRARPRRDCRIAGRAGRQAARQKSRRDRSRPRRHRRCRLECRAGKSAARRPRRIQRADLDAASPAASGKIRRRRAARDQERAGAEGRPADRDPGTGRRRQPPRAHPGAARRHRLRQDLHDGEGDRGDAAARAGAGAEQDAGRAALWRVQEFLPRQRGGIFRLVLRLLPAGSLCPAHRHLYREGFLDQRADRPHAPLGDARAAGARRRDHRRLGVLHLRYRLGRDLFGDDLLAEEGRTHRAAPADRRPGRAAIQAHAGFFARHLPGARRHHRNLSGAL